MEKTFWEMFDSSNLKAYWENVNVHMNDPMIGQKYMPTAKQAGLELSWIKGVNNLPVALQPSAFDTKASLRDRQGVSELKIDMPFFREAMRIGEKDRQLIMTLKAAGNRSVDAVVQRVFDDLSGLIDGANVQTERLRMAALSKGQFQVTASAESGRTAKYICNYDSDGSWTANNTITLSGTDTWTDANKAANNPIKALMDAVELMKNTRGVTVVEMLMNTTTLKGLLASESIVKAINPVGYTNMIIASKDIKDYVMDKTELKITTYDKMFKNEQGVDEKFFPDGYVTLLPSYAVGNTWYGTTPEEADLMSGLAKNSTTSIVNTGVAITTITESHPVNIQTIVSQIAMPSFERMNDVYVMKVF